MTSHTRGERKLGHMQAIGRQWQQVPEQTQRPPEMDQREDPADHDREHGRNRFGAAGQRTYASSAWVTRRMAEINVPAWLMPIQKTKFVM